MRTRLNVGMVNHVGPFAPPRQILVDVRECSLGRGGWGRDEGCSADAREAEEQVHRLGHFVPVTCSPFPRSGVLVLGAVSEGGLFEALCPHLPN